MDALLMCGGLGRRLNADREKPLVAVGGRPMVERVRGALAESGVDRTVGVVSPATPETAARLDCPLIRAPGEGYVADLEWALAESEVSRPVLTVAADLPLLDGAAIDRVHAAGGTLTVAVPAGRKRGLGASVDTAFRHGGRLVAPAGINVVGEGEGAVCVTTDRRYAINVNRPADRRLAEWTLAGGDETITRPPP